MKVEKRDGTRQYVAKYAALVVSLVVTAYLVNLASAEPEHAWFGWGALLPLFAAIRVCGSIRAGLCGGLWGLTLAVLATTAGDTGATLSLGSLLLLTAAPAVYAGLGSKLTRWIAYSPFVLGVGWMGVEFALDLAGLSTGLWVSVQSDGTVLHWVIGGLGYVFSALLVAYVTALLVSVLSEVGITVPRPRPASGSGDASVRVAPQTFCCFPLSLIPASQPRAPPALFTP